MRRFTVSIVCAWMAWVALAGAQSLTFSRGQNVSPAYEGWEEDPDGTKHFVFGYMNRNWEEELDVPVGPDNNIQPGSQDQGQPTRFLPRRNRFMFSGRVGGRRLRPGRYRLVATPRVNALVGKAVRARFRIARG